MVGKLILNVDDNEIGRYSKTRMLRFAGFEVVEAADGISAFAYLDSQLPDLVLLDVNLPDLSGYEICKRLKADPRTTRLPVILTSAAFTRGTDRARGLEGGADGYLVEPIEPEVIQATISSVLRAREAEDAALVATEQWESTFRAISEGIAVIDNEGMVLRCNEQFLRLSESKSPEAKSSDRQSCQGVVLETWLIRQGVNVPITLYSLFHSDKREMFELEMHHRWYQVTVDPVLTPLNGSNSFGRTGAVIIFSDITSRRNAESAIIQARNAAETANAAKDRFLAVLSHELRTPLTPILMSVDGFLSDLDVHDGFREGLEMIRRNVELEARLIDDLLDLTRIVRGKFTLRKHAVNIEQLVRHALEMSQAEIDDKRLQLSMDLNATETMVHGDSARLQQVLWNLIKNAVKFTPHQGTISIRAYNPEPGSIAIEVQDSGIGMNAEALNRVFEPFEQADENITRRFGGLGLGLAIGKNIAELHSGTLQALSEGEGRGSTFTLTLDTMPRSESIS